MFKKFGFIILLILSIYGIVLGGKYIYDKQAHQLNFANFQVSDDANIFYIPNISLFDKLNFNTKSFNFPTDIIDAYNEVLDFLKKENANNELYLSYYGQDYSVAIKHPHLNSNQLISSFKNKLGVIVNEQNNTIKINSKELFYFIETDFFVISNSKVIIAKNKSFKKSNGNYHYSYKSRLKGETKKFKQDKKIVYSFESIISETVKGKPVSVIGYYNTIPSSFDTLRFYGSSRISEDINNLTKVNGSSDFFRWIENSIIHLKKDSMEILIGVQNDFQNLGDILDEQTILISTDSLLKQSIFRNNYEIKPFKSSYNWKNIIPYNTFPFNYYCELNNYNVLGNSVEAMNWFVTELQLGNVFNTIDSNYPHPQKINQLTLIKSDSIYHIRSKNWLTKTNCFISEVLCLNSVNINSVKLPLTTNFSTSLVNFKMQSITLNDTLQILVFTDKKIISYNELGLINWTKELAYPLIVFPKKVKVDTVDFIALILKNSVDLIDVNNKSKDGFPIEFDSQLIKAKIVQNTSNFRVLIETNNMLININEKGEFTKGWKNQMILNRIKSNIEIAIIDNKTVINFVDSEDSLHIIDKFGNSILETSLVLNNKNYSNLLSGETINTNLRVHGFSNPYIINQLIQSGQKDSLKINQKLNPTNIQWVENNSKTYLVIEEYNRVIIFNEYGLLEKEIQKPKPNLKLISTTFFDEDVIIFIDIKNNELYLLNSYGKSLIETPIFGGSNFTFDNKNVIVYNNSKIYIYTIQNK